VHRPWVVLREATIRARALRARTPNRRETAVRRLVLGAGLTATALLGSCHVGGSATVTMPVLHGTVTTAGAYSVRGAFIFASQGRRSCREVAIELDVTRRRIVSRCVLLSASQCRGSVDGTAEGESTWDNR
jgi:hypothetical protein